MTAQAGASPQAGFPPPLFSFGALFGLRERGEPTWRYEPPSLNNTKPLSFPFDIPLPSKPSNPSILSPDLNTPPPEPAPADLSPADVERTLGNAAQIPVLEVWIDEPERVSAQELQDSSLDDIGDSFAQFEDRLAYAGPLAKENRYPFLIKTYNQFCPTSDDSGEFSLLVLRHLLENHWASGHIVCCLSRPHVQLPHIYTSDGLAFLESLDQMTTLSPHRVRGMRRMYQKLAESARSLPPSNGHSQDSSLRLLIRGLWDSFLSPGKAVQAPILASLRVMGGKLSDSRAQKYLATILQDPGKESVQVSSLVTACTRKPDLVPLGVEVLQCVPRAAIDSWITSMPFWLLELQHRAPAFSASPRHTQYFQTWTKLLHGLDGKADSVPGVSWSDLTFKHLSKVYISRRTKTITPHAVVAALLYAWTSHESLAGISSTRIDDFIDRCAPHLVKQSAEKYSLDEMLTGLLIQINEMQLPNHGIVELAVANIHQHKGLRSVTSLLERVKASGSTLSDTSFLDNTIIQALDQFSARDGSLTRKESQHHALILQACQKLQKLQGALGAHIHVRENVLTALQARRQFQHILDRAHDAHIVPLAHRKLTADISTKGRIELIHHFAHQYSLDATRSHRQKWRSIYYLYKYLQRNNLEVSRLFSQAVVRACIIQPMLDNQFVSARRLSWVCRLVAKTEGEEEARRIEHIFWVSRGELILRARRTLVASGNHSPAHVSTMKRLGMM